MMYCTFGKCNNIKLGFVITSPFLYEKNVGPYTFGRGGKQASVIGQIPHLAKALDTVLYEC